MSADKGQIPRPEYPRPQLVREPWLNLNGRWGFELDPGSSGEERGLPAARGLRDSIVVPFCPESALSGIGLKDFMPCVWYRRSFMLPDSWAGKKVLLHFGAVDYETRVWINGRLAGEHRGGYSSFAIDITDLLVAGENDVVVRALDDTRSPLQPSGKQSLALRSSGCTYSRCTGIWQTVWLEAVPRTHLESLRIYPDPAGGSVTIHARTGGETSGATLAARVLAAGSEVGAAKCHALGHAAVTIKLSEVHLWEPADPFLYDLELVVERNGEQLDHVKSYLGLRAVSIQGKKILLNGRALFQRLVLDQGYYPDGIYTAPTDEELKRDIELAQAMGFNGARLHQKVFEPRFLYWADRLGYLVWGEYPNWGLDPGDPRALKRVLPEWLEVLERDFNHPSVIGWCPFNETLALNRTTAPQDPDLIHTVYRVTKAVDPTRPVIDSSAYVHVETDIYDCHNAEQDPKKLATLFEPFKRGDEPWRNLPELNAPYAGQPFFVSEYGGTLWAEDPAEEGAWGYGEKPRTEGEFLERYRALTETLLFHPNMCGFCYIQLYDVEQEANGLYTYRRKAKFDPAVIRGINSQKAAIEGE